MLLLLDVDGVLNPYAAKPTRRPEGYQTHRLTPSGWSGFKPLRLWLNPDHGPMLLGFAEAIGVELAWATTWTDDANTMIGPRIGLPELPVVPYKGINFVDWKYPETLEWLDGRPAAWLDDDFDLSPVAKAEFVQARQAPTLLHLINPAIGLRAEDLDAVATWVEAVRAL